MTMTRISRRSLITGLGALGASGALAACGGGPAGSATPNEVSFANWSDNFADLYTQSLDAYEAQSGVTVVRQADVPFDDYQTRFRTLLSGGQPPGLMRLNDDFVREMTDKEQLADLGERISGLSEEEYFADVAAFTALESGQGGLPIGSSPRVLFYNKTMLQEAGITPPSSWVPDQWQWDDVLAAAQEVTGGDRYGICLWTDTGFENTFAVNNGGPGIFSADGTSFTLADPAGIEAIQWVVDLTLKHKVQPTWAYLTGEDADLRLFTAGNLGMFFGTMGLATYMRENVTDFEWDVAPMPAKVEQRQEGSLSVFVVPRESADVDRGWELLQWMVGRESGSIFAEAGAFIPLHREAAALVEKTSTQGENMALFAEAAGYQTTVNSTRATAQAVQLYRPQLERAYIGEISVEEALTSVRAQVERVIG
ncbi:sugar ABC transporter substrate-binding protein [Desertihabitans brevis]|uniref:Sugar ABC transporter substrate-binding protein n=1 Tax=Desertihabitans brevis TaxID=2268447 RepID=A0A367YWC3_9ACTN|nr:sugar ABC transporter substrate-binding protein [Desertihabitans brevis]RCK70174.1 sugar ABC transporter substrate-binding protein [Desertihabitans brevis]